ncbi:conserved hypothetical protein [Arthrobacter sp. 9AX]|uniref:GIY-YIG nuclease family protein n=1 Tax=Arthrobacter sp. 9AX TaxID=2653131 RepID=UPI0012F0BD08|nr:GIY-YIG nuclease family protein [Arthrobacter sp. 9AX]VXC53606.1 conserved hypothetical protein [Arthrobacter sp. 9AX]
MNDALVFTRYPATTGISVAYLLESQEGYHGIYVLRFADGTEYVGKAVDVLNRFRWHARHQHDSIVSLDFAPVTRASLDQLELLTIRWRKEEGAHLRNILLMGSHEQNVAPSHWLPHSYPVSFSILDPKASQINNFARNGSAGADLVRSYARLVQHPHAEIVIEVLAAYIRASLPSPARTEGRVWVVTALPRSDDGMRRLACLTVQNMQMLTLFDDERGGIYALLNLAASPKLSTRYDAKDFWRESNATKTRLLRLAPEVLIRALNEDREFREATSGAVTMWLNRGPSLISRFHCWPLADALYAHISRST